MSKQIKYPVHQSTYASGARASRSVAGSRSRQHYAPPYGVLDRREINHHQLNDTVTEVAGMARNVNVRDSYAGSF